MNASIISKSYTGGSANALLLEPSRAYIRQTALPVNWKKARLTCLFSFTNTTDESGVPVSESISLLGFRNRFAVGLCNGVPPAFGDASFKFLGFCAFGGPGYPSCVSWDGSKWVIAYSAGGSTDNPQGVIVNGTTEILGGYQAATAYGAASPAGTTNFAFALTVDLDISSNGVLKTYVNSINNISTVDTLRLNQALMASEFGTTTTTSGGWWNSTTPVNCTHLFVYFPFLSNRLICYGFQVMQLE